ncbi:MAG: hypothetical protein IPM15_13955 [Betaproteobacteria bacterium]|nr:hypothetical protein [Betaproteobacteria bacterium]MCL4699365.1 hypothetical protein [Burkholderiaceae bacterium]
MNARPAAPARPARGLQDLQVWGECLPEPLFGQLRRRLSLANFGRWRRAGLPFYRTTFWYPSRRAPSHVVEQAIEVLRKAARPSSQVAGVEWWFSVVDINATPQWLLPCHFDRADLDEADPARIRHPESASVFFFDAVPYGELVVTDQVLGEDGRPSPREPRRMRFVPPGENRYAVFPGHLYHGVIGRLWRPEADECLRVSLAVNWWTERPAAPYLLDSGEAVRIFELDAAPAEAPAS